MATRGGRPVHVSLSALEKALRLVDDLAETEDPADFGERALPGLGLLVRCDSLSYNEIGPAPGRVVTCACPACWSPRSRWRSSRRTCTSTRW